MGIGGNFRHTKNDDGSVTIHDVPIFCACSRGKTEYDEAWLRSATAFAQQADTEGHLPPLHVSHHGEPGVRPEVAGMFRVLGVRPMRFKGRKVPAIYADLIVTSKTVLERIESLQLPYRSVEIIDGKIISCALLDTEAPYLDLPMTTLAAVPGGTNAGDSVQLCGVGSSAVVAFSQRGAVVRAYMQGADEMTTKTLASSGVDHRAGTCVFTFSDGTTETHSAAQYVTLLAKFSQPKPAQDPAPEPEKFEADEDKGEDKEQMAEGESCADVGAIVKAIEDGSISIADFAAIKEAMARAEAGPEDDGVEAPGNADDDGPGDLMQAKGGEDVTRLASRVEVAEQKLVAFQAERDMERALAAAEKALEGRPISMTKVRAYFQAHGIKAGQAHVEDLREQIPAAPGPDFGERFGAGSDAPAEVLKYEAKSTDLGAEARKQATLWKRASDAGHTHLSLERWLELNIETPATRFAAR